MTWFKQKMKGQITINTLTGVIILIGAIGAPFLYVSNIKAEGTEADAKMQTAIAVNATNITNLEKQLDNMDSKLDALLMKQGINPAKYNAEP